MRIAQAAIRSKPIRSSVGAFIDPASIGSSIKHISILRVYRQRLDVGIIETGNALSPACSLVGAAIYPCPIRSQVNNRRVTRVHRNRRECSAVRAHRQRLNWRGGIGSSKDNGQVEDKLFLCFLKPAASQGRVRQQDGCDKRKE